MVERIVINGTDIDLSSGQSLSICIKSNILKKTSEFGSCYSFSYSVPMTTTNKAVFGELLSVGNLNKRVRMFLPAEYYRDNFKIFDGQAYVSDVETDKFSIVLLFGVNNALQQIKDEGLMINEIYNSPNDTEVKNYTAEELLEYKRYIPLTSRAQMAHYPFDEDNAKDTQVFALYDSSAGIATLTGSKLAVRAKRIFDLIRERYGLKIETSVNTKSVWVQTAQSNRKDKFKINYFLHQRVGALIDNEVMLRTAQPDIEYSNLGNLIHGIDYEIDSTGSNIAMKQPYKLERVKLTLDIGYPSSGTIVYTNVARNALNYPTPITETNTVAKWDPEHTHIDVEFSPKELGLEYEWGANNTGMREYVDTCGSIVLISDNKDILPEPHNVRCIMTYSLNGENVGVGYINSVDSLPTISITQFIQDFVFGCAGEYILNDFKGGNKLRCVNLETVSTNKPYDWTLKIIGSELKVENKLEGIAKKNHVKWATSQVEAKKLSTIYTQDATISEEDDLYNSSFGKLDGITNFTYYGGVSIVPPPKLVSVAFGRSLLLDDGNYALAVNRNFDWIDNEYQSWEIMKKTLEKPTRIECDVVFGSAELASLDLSRPVYLGQFGAIFVIEEITVTGEKGKVKLIQLKK